MGSILKSHTLNLSGYILQISEFMRLSTSDLVQNIVKTKNKLFVHQFCLLTKSFGSVLSLLLRNKNDKKNNPNIVFYLSYDEHCGLSSTKRCKYPERLQTISK